ncbi:hypothetical protein PFICI_13450 [Pestalotiopsis fici W106-1]|uniref:Zn(2)-C6 fungal-type domain-containing protein n=1 Tax=Pestalotiopsis fici (strain W106-1 / CGMCC3.15140) TaxID=1229662 RepID=W3WQ62_PESFW|nr:uncharacterized protein PFICI_13450 [Pestalotiopsis fici W106-1]ETS74966.1 hypothetical protein PFICI_13450 [Pestalotiopsis fici W106-1]
MTKPLPIRQRAYAPKTRAGCVGCKTRRRKCDEAKPQCEGCRRRRLVCVYGPSRAQLRDTTKQLVNIQPMPTRELQLYHEPSRSVFAKLSSAEVPYLDYFVRKLVHRLSFPGLGNTGLVQFLSQTALQQCEHNEHILHAVVGIGALAYFRQSKSTNVPLYQHRLSGCLENEHYRRAVKHYGQAIASTRSLMQDDASRQPWLVLITCVLFVLFEQLQDNTDAIDKLTASVIKFLNSPTRGSLASGDLLAAAVDDTGVAEAEHFICNNVVNNSMFSPMYPQCRKHLHDLSILSPQMAAIVGPEKSVAEFVSGWFRVGTVMVSPSLSFAQDLTMPRETVIAIMSAWEQETQRRLLSDPKPTGHSAFLLRYVGIACKAVTQSPPRGPADRDLSVGGHEIMEMMQLIEDEFEANRPTLTLEDSELIGEGSYDVTLPGLFIAARDMSSYPVRLRALNICRRILRPSSSWSNKAIYLGLCALVEIEGAGQTQEGATESQLGEQYNWTEGYWNEDYTKLHVVLQAVTPPGDLGHTPRRRHLIVSPQAYGLA